MSESIVRKIQPFTIGTKLSAPGGHDYRTLDSCALQRRLTGQVSPGLVRAPDTLALEGERRGEQEMDLLNRNETSATTTTTTAPSSRSIRKITICSGLESRRTAAHIRASSENINNNNNIFTQLPKIVGVSCENQPPSHLKVLLRKDSDDEQRSTSERTNGFLLNGENRSGIQQVNIIQIHEE
ncbi:hypothetical protein MHYP_G00042810 [Metynnis hypsauchen]